MPVQRNGAELVASRNGVALAASRNGVLLLSPGGRPHPVISVSPDRALSTLDLGAGDGAVFRWNPGVGATGVRVVFQDGSDPVTDLARRSHRVRSFDLSGGHYLDTTATIVSRNASGESPPASATLFRYWPVVITTATRQLPGVRLNRVPFSRVALDLSIQGRPFPDEITISPGGSRGAPTSHQLQRFFEYERSDASFTRSRTGGHAIIMQRPSNVNESVTYTITAISRLRGVEVSRAVKEFSIHW